MKTENKFKLLFVLLIAINFPLHAQQISIKGSIPNYTNGVVSLRLVQDYVSNKEIILKQTQTDSVGNFAIDFPLTETTQLIIRTDESQGSFFAEPSNDYSLQLSVSDSNAIIALSAMQNVAVKVLNKPSDELNMQIEYFEQMLDSFYSENNIFFAQPRILQKKYSEFKQQHISKLFPNKNIFLNDYINYSMAPIEEAIYKNKEYSFKHYFTATIKYHHPIYMQYFNSYFNHHLKVLMNGKYGENILASINEMHSYSAAMEGILKCDSLLKNDTLRELVLMKGLQEIYYEKGMNKQNVEMILSYISLKGIGVENKIIAKNLLDNLNALEVGTMAPVITLNHPKYKTTSDLKGNLIYVIFWATWNAESLQELKLMQKINTKYGHRVSFIAINIDEQNEQAKSYFTKNKFDFYAVYDAEKNVMKEFNAKSIPYSVLIDDDGDILKTQAVLPSNNLENFIKRLIKRKK